jgi:hypothetical protein
MTQNVLLVHLYFLPYFAEIGVFWKESEFSVISLVFSHEIRSTFAFVLLISRAAGDSRCFCVFSRELAVELYRFRELPVSCQIRNTLLRSIQIDEG